ncbi:bifunctional (p)ppGpp synthetase/guanosine-3',5'-bis(diphosphate) 3'-pyrophosphohydrolase [Azospirillum baldaniorum]|uniref:Bifunctional (P)ppGpp synthetase/guanosine-3',5'-bis(Diphosphate) 3'-pyrophosphohydrolase n=3 Tax=Azospirillum TaxID=191 RepID=A0A2K1G0Y6_9PROT|nr:MULTISPECIES: HD domain-containing protein [Azospirillum]TWA80985.1 HD domain-containing protein [Azospirillum brasilense]AWJ89390.1 bifunctional (p)ppGpp synthetase/guanosine-3',5'-bis(diphosphate) 3'-pyrophosphohydrolase [Azospirillum baldaniorum]KAA1058497.1 Metal-dependent phosphohydrolase [Azospirillum argentinense]NUB07597.1 bifunctional (p)ppGpp synthetase/guanosine-3',5'-bis(diphosphate) 3'-pyrophosphohydrolase [Azospirillum baldaniorum]PNQ98456.1 bifunctional (p)ppGpp synthetase/gu
MTALLDFARALEFAAHKHIDQRRKGVRAEPYLNHLSEVAFLCAEATAGNDPVVVIAALLHDTLEDTDASYEEIEQHFGAEVAGVVAETTDDKRLRKAERKQRQIDAAPTASSRAKLVKLADKVSNLRSMAHSPPADWPLERKIEYFEWAHAVVAGLRGTDARLESLFDRAYEDGLAELRGEAV